MQLKVTQRREDRDEIGSILVMNFACTSSSEFLRGPAKGSILERLINVFGENIVKFELTISLAQMHSENEVPDGKSLIALTAEILKLIETTHKSVNMSADILNFEFIGEGRGIRSF